VTTTVEDSVSGAVGGKVMVVVSAAVVIASFFAARLPG
jgi:hypothetical protein